VLAALIVTEIGEMTRFRNAGQLGPWAGLNPRHRESDTKVSRGHVTKQGSRLLRWALTGAIQRVPADSVTGGVKAAIIARRGKEARSIAKVAAARRLLTLVFYGMRDGQIRCLSRPSEDPPAPPAARA
jgi:transposase